MSPPNDATVPVFVINLDRDIERLNRFARVAEYFGVPFERWRATPGDDLDHNSFGIRPIMPGIFIDGFTEWSRNEAACGVSHIRLLQSMIDQEIPWAVILEDDAILRQAIPSDIDDWGLPTDAEIVLLSHRAETSIRENPDHGFNYGPVVGGAGTEGYLISHSGAQKLLKVLAPLSNPLDFQMYAHFSSLRRSDTDGLWDLPRNQAAADVELIAYRIVPNLVEHRGDSSAIGNRRHPRARFLCKMLLGLDFGEGASYHSYPYASLVAGRRRVLDLAPAPLASGTIYRRGVDASHWDPERSYLQWSEGDTKPRRRELFDILLDAGVNIVRFNLFLDGMRHPFGLDRALRLAGAAADRGLGICPVLHLSDTWAYPSQQLQPTAWRHQPLSELARSVRDYTRHVTSRLVEQGTPPDLLQVGNELTNGMLWADPTDSSEVGGGLRADDPRSWDHFTLLLRAGIEGVRTVAGGGTEVIVHFDKGGDAPAAVDWFERLNGHDVDYDIMGVSIHDHWTAGGKLHAIAGLGALTEALPRRQLIVAETSHPYRPADRFPAKPTDSDPDHSPEGQADYLRKVLELLRQNPNATGVFWWGSVFFDDSIEHCPDFLKARALFASDGSALPALWAFRN